MSYSPWFCGSGIWGFSSRGADCGHLKAVRQVGQEGTRPLLAMSEAWAGMSAMRCLCSTAMPGRQRPHMEAGFPQSECPKGPRQSGRAQSLTLLAKRTTEAAEVLGAGPTSPLRGRSCKEPLLSISGVLRRGQRGPGAVVSEPVNPLSELCANVQSAFFFFK